jgi:peptide chain release factor subunit 1
MIISKDDMAMLLAREPTETNSVLSVYLEVDQSHSVNLRRGFETTLKSMLHALLQQQQDKQQRLLFEQATERVLHFVTTYEPSARGLVIFCDPASDFFWQRELRAQLYSDASWDTTPYLRPLLETLDEFERYGVVLVDRSRGRLFTVYMGEIEEAREFSHNLEVKHPRSTTQDKLRNTLRNQRRGDLHARWHLKHVAQQITEMADKYDFDRLILAGQSENTTELASILPKRLLSRLVGDIPLSLNSPEHEVLEQTMAVEQRFEREHEARQVEQLIIAASKENRAVLGLEATLKALGEKSAWRLLYAEGLTCEGARCTNCASLFAREIAACSYCGQRVVAIDDIVEPIVRAVIDLDGRVEAVRGEAADKLRQNGGIGAFLRF